MNSAQEPLVLGRYVLCDEIASGGMASVHLGRLNGAIGFSRIVAIKRLHKELAADRDFVHMFVDEARLVSRIRHSNVVPTLDVVALNDELFLVMEYVHGESLLRLLRAVRKSEMRIPERIVTAVVAGMLHGLHAAHEARGELGEPLGIVHRDVSPANVLVGADGGARVLDFGLARASARLTHTPGGTLKGKVSYMAPENIHKGGVVDRRADVYAAAVVLWEALTGDVLFDGPNDAAVLKEVLAGHAPAPSTKVRDLPRALDEICSKALHHDPDRRYRTAQEMAVALQNAVTPAQPSEVGEWVAACAGDALARRAARVAAIELGTEDAGPSAPWLSDSALVTVSASHPVARPRSSQRPFVWGGAMVAVACALGLLLARSPRAEPPAVSAAGTVAPVAPVAQAEPSSAASADAPQAPPFEIKEIATVPPAPSGSAAKARVRAASRPACDPPFVRDGLGRKIWKRECL